MKNLVLLTFFILVFGILQGCKESAEERRKKSVEMMTTQTLGLAYLEEFKLEEAESQFVKLIELSPDDKIGYANLGLVYLRMAKYAEAEEQILMAARLDPDDANISLLLSTVYQMDGRRPEAIEVLKKALTKESDHSKILYDLSELYSADPGIEAEELRKTYLGQLVIEAPENIVPQLQLIELLIKEGKSDQAIERLEIIKKQFPEFPKESVAYYTETIDLLRAPDLDKALISFTIFHNYLKVSFPYQAGINQLKGPGGSLIGFPLISYNRQVMDETIADKSVLEVITFTDISDESGLSSIKSYPQPTRNFKNTTHIRTADYNGDGHIDIYIGSYNDQENAYKHYMMENKRVSYQDVTKNLGIAHQGKEYGAVFADYDNDGFLDLYVHTETGNILYRNADQGILEDKTATSKIIGNAVEKALFFDMDQDGDLDLFQASTNGDNVFRNNGDGSFANMTAEMGLSSEHRRGTIDAAFGDFDDDGDVDLITTGKTGTYLYSNERQGKYELVQNSGFKAGSEGNSIVVVDVNNDGFLDVLVGSSKLRNNKLHLNAGNGTFEEMTQFSSLLGSTDELTVLDVASIDFDNDGFQDLLLTGEPAKPDGTGLLLFHNDGAGGFINTSSLIKTPGLSGCQLQVYDHDSDGDRDILIALSNGGVKLFRNDGGNMNHYVNMKLVGLRTGSAKNNYFGIGSKVELRAGDLYQSMVVTDPNIYFGLGHREKADIIRITWTNGVPQNILLPNADQALIESQTLKGSCPFLYTWNGKEYEFVKDITWRSALGMPLGIMGGTTKYAFADASDDYIKIENAQLAAIDGKYKIQITSELWETIYMDQLELLAVDHPAGFDLFVPEQFSPPPFPGLKLYQVDKKLFPSSATDDLGRDVLPMILHKDDRYIDNLTADTYQGVTKMHDLILDPGKAGKMDGLHLFLRGWIFPTDASINVALSQSEILKVQAPIIQVINKNGLWQTVQTGMSFPMGKDKTVIVNLEDKFLSADHRIRIRTNMEIYWDEIFFASVQNSEKMSPHVLKAERADLHYRGFSHSYRKGGRYGPHWFDYNKVDSLPKWRDLTGAYTKYGDVLPLLAGSDNQYVISNAGDEVSLTFDESSLPELPKGWVRDFFIHSVGWVKDGDLNTAAGQTVSPLPFHNMKAYPPSEKDSYPKNIKLSDYNKNYNTRIVSQSTFQNSIKPILNEE